MTTATQLKLRGMSQTAAKHAGVLHVAQGIAKGLNQARLGITSDDVKAFMCEHGWTDEELAKALGNAAGLIFSGDDWVPIGWKASTRPASHGRAIRVWRLK